VRCQGERAPAQPAPELGADTESILSGLGYDAACIARLKAVRAI
jgi:crotonobetainyl-CoA:carnitine CoA-transferase CaiB-like acyl-CoA transferase